MIEVKEIEKKKKVIVDLMNDPHYAPMKLKELAILLQVERNRREELKEILDVLLSEGKISLSKRGKYGKAQDFSLSGMFIGNQRGFGFVTVEGMNQDVFIPAEYAAGALHGDKVLLVLLPESGKGKKREGKILKILERANTEIIGTYQKSKHFGFVIPDNQKLAKDIFIPEGKDKGAVTGHKVVVSIKDFGDDRKKPEGQIKEIIGHANDPETDILSIIKAYGLPEEFPKEVMDSLQTIPDYVSAEEKVGRLDLRHLPTVTIDGEDAKDLDDAITISKEDGVYTLGVHIADVTHYVQENSPLDKEALKRATSIYLVDRVIPMLPHKLSNGICSLNSGTDRLALSCIMTLNEHGVVTGHQIAETVIHVDERMTYTDVNAIIEHHDTETCQRYESLVPMFELMGELSGLIRKQREHRGAIDFDFPESKVIMNADGKPVDIKPYDRNRATKLIEDFMLTANETVAEDFFWQELPFLYRTHEKPDAEKLIQLGVFISNFGYGIHLGADGVHPKELQKLLGRIAGSDEEALISRLTLRSMRQARYLSTCEGHFGLAAKYYTHFTSPIRRYPDLQIHRIIKESLKNGLKEKRLIHYGNILPDVALHSSQMERRAEEAERETIKLKKVEYMSKYVGETFEGVISGVTGWGFYVELPNTVEGMVRVQSLTDDYYIFDEYKYELVGEMTKKRYHLGMKIKVVVSGTDVITKTIDFLPELSWGAEEVSE